jgi:hypothetical protein
VPQELDGRPVPAQDGASSTAKRRVRRYVSLTGMLTDLVVVADLLQN